jgi:ubiquinone/menaquinone biosynthesis C-methylase UbiE
MRNSNGEDKNFDINWRTTKEAHYLHWTRDEPKNQIQLAFRQHWLTFSEILKLKKDSKRILEVGCGRGSLSAYFSDAGWDCTLLDLSPAAIEIAQKSFEKNELRAKFDVGDCMNLSYENNSFDAVFSIGLLEHFIDIGQVIKEQIRILKPGGIFIAYIVPEMKENIQTEYKWICDLLSKLTTINKISEKKEVFRSDYLSETYINHMKLQRLKNIKSSGIYPLPMISFSTEFPFSLLPDEAEKIVVNHFNKMLKNRKTELGIQNPWLCDEKYGQALLVWGEK